MAAKTARPPSRLKSSIVARLNAQLFFRLLGIYLFLDLLLILLFCGGLLVWSEGQAAHIAVQVEEQGLPAPEDEAWTHAAGFTLTDGAAPARGYSLPTVLTDRLDPPEAPRFFEPGDLDPVRLFSFRTGEATRYTIQLERAEGPYTLTLDLTRPTRIFCFAARVVVFCQLVSLVLNLFKNAGTIRRTLRPIQDLAAAASRLGSSMSPEELQALAGKLDEINASHLDRRIPVTGTQKELKTLAQAINAMLDRINEAYRSQSRFVSDASHELRTPIAVIQGYASLLDRWGKDDPATRQEAIDAIRQEADSMKALVEQLLFLARGDNDSVRFQPQLCDLTELAAEVLRETEMLDQTHHFAAKWLCAVPVVADEALIKQALRILVDNAVKYTPAEGRISLSVEGKDGLARLTVADDGQGIDKDSLPHVFDRFYRTDESRARQTGGTGLGLSIAKWIADRHNGWFEVVSWPGVGTRFTLVLPLDPMASAPPS